MAGYCSSIAELVYGKIECGIDSIAWEEHTLSIKKVWKVSAFHKRLPELSDRQELVETMISFGLESFFHERIKCLFEEFVNTNYSVAPGPHGEKGFISQADYTLGAHQNVRNTIHEVARWHTWGLPTFEGELDLLTNAEDQLKLHDSMGASRLKKATLSQLEKEKPAEEEE